ncbi:MAG: LuxR family transcriptional regulator, partial [Nitriliruptorales bacterium]|nr:LuxR family transcriptional regulator [Nitriliruptorales bacterium]
MTGVLAVARDAYGRRDWMGAWDNYQAACAARELPADDVFALSDVAWWLGLMDESIAAADEAYRRYLHGDRPRQAAMAAIGIAVTSFLRGDEVIGSGWMSRAQRVLRDVPESPEHGYVRYLLEVESGL